jgi:SAM-dependent methyltransferase
MSGRSPVVLPPRELITRVGDDPGDTVEAFHGNGARHRELLESYLPANWTWSGKVFLDWGAGAGRLVRHFVDEATQGRVIAADIDEPSIEWIREHLAPVEALLVDEKPGIDLGDASVDLVSGFSVMTHVADHWAGWLLEIRRILKPGGLALLSVCGGAMLPLLLDRPVPIDDVGMLVIKYANPWRFGGPTVAHSPWWIRTHWGRAFEILRLDPAALQGVKTGHDLVLLRRDDRRAPSIEQLEAVDPSDRREVTAVATALRQARLELSALREAYETAREEAYTQRLVAADFELKLSVVQRSHSWRFTRPFRAITNRLHPVDGWRLE